MTRPEPSPTPEQLDALREEIADEVERLERRMKSSADTVRPVDLDPGAVGRLSRMDELQNQAMARNLRDREWQRLADLERALERMEKGTYGTCARCGGSIQYARLEAFPEAATCVACSR
ncbi:MAG: TraR/DksA family transcriptional regulator [Gemmatimonadetes bacterium]|nr:TraR/DksA family transcriptional regulator [Gemmatimonadota bacterium]